MWPVAGIEGLSAALRTAILGRIYTRAEKTERTDLGITEFRNMTTLLGECVTLQPTKDQGDDSGRRPLRMRSASKCGEQGNSDQDHDTTRALVHNSAWLGHFTQSLKHLRRELNSFIIVPTSVTQL